MANQRESKVKITVIKAMSPNEVFGGNVPVEIIEEPFVKDLSLKCDRLTVGQEFVVPADSGACPAGFCAWAFADLHRDITHLRLGGNYYWYKGAENMTFSCCTHGVSPVFFKLERID